MKIASAVKNGDREKYLEMIRRYREALKNGGRSLCGMELDTIESYIRKMNPRWNKQPVMVEMTLAEYRFLKEWALSGLHQYQIQNVGNIKVGWMNEQRAKLRAIGRKQNEG